MRHTSRKMTSTRQPSENQLVNYKASHQNQPACNLTSSAGEPRPSKDASLTAGPKGVTLLQDYFLINELAHFDRERIPERVVHAKGAAAFGHFEVTHDITQYTAAKVFESIGKKTPVAARFSQVAGESGSADTVRDPRGFAVKFYTEEGIWDLVGNNTPIFFIRDAVLFPSFIHSQKRNPVTHLKDFDAYWDFLTLRPESTHQVMYMYSDRGIPKSYRNMNGYGSNTYSLINAQGERRYCKFHHRTDQGIDNFDVDEAERTAGRDPDHYIRDLYNNIANGNYPSWSFYIQIMTEEQAERYRFNPFDVTKVWYHSDFPLIPVGKLTLNRNASNYFAEIEQLSFSPANFVPGIAASPDKMLQGRLFSYTDTHRYRLGVNYEQLPVNAPFRVCNYHRDGTHTIDNQNGAPVYHPNSFGGPEPGIRAQLLNYKFNVDGVAAYYDSGNEDNFTQPRNFYRNVLSSEQRRRLINNLASTIRLSNPTIQQRAVDMFTKVDEDLGRRLALALQNR